MKKILAICWLLLASSAHAVPDDSSALEKQADAAFTAKDFVHALALYERALARSWFYRLGGVLHRLWVESGEDQVVSEDAGVQAVSSDGKTLYTTQGVGTVHRELVTNFGDRPRSF